MDFGHLTQNINNTINEQNTLKAQIVTANTEMGALTAQLNGANAQIAALNAQIVALTNKINSAKSALA